MAKKQDKKTTSKKTTSKKVTTKATTKAKAPATKKAPSKATAPKKSTSKPATKPTVKKAASTAATTGRKKADVLKSKGIKLRSVTSKDKQEATTTYQREAKFIITTSNKQEYYSTNGSLKDCLWAESNSKKVK